MASAIIHMCVANEINKIIKRNGSKLLIGSIAPDISKQIGESKERSHFLIDNIEEEIPMKNTKIIIDKLGIIIENTKINKPYIFDVEQINKFIKLSVNIILNNLKELGIN